MLQSRLLGTLCRSDGLSGGLWAKMSPLDFGRTVKCASRAERCPELSCTTGSVLPISEMVRRGWEFSGSLIEKAGPRKLKLFFCFCRRVSISKKLSSEEICQPSDGISGGDQKEMARLGYQVALRSGHSPGMWKIKVRA